MTSWASLAWHVTVVGGAAEPAGLLFQAVAGVASTAAAVQGCLEPGLPTWSLALALGLSLAIKDILDTIIYGCQVNTQMSLRWNKLP